MERSKPAVVIVGGYPDSIVPEDVRRKVQPLIAALARRIEAAGMQPVTYPREHPARDLAQLLETLHTQVDRIALWAASGNAPTALSALLQDAPPHVTCAVMLYPFLLDTPGSTSVADAAQQFGFANSTAGKSVSDLRADVPMLVARAGADAFAGLNATLDRFVNDALSRDMPLTLVNYPSATHGFDPPQEAIEWVRSRSA